MQKLIPIILACFVFCSCASQKNTKVYAYRQAMIGGAAPRSVTDEKGNQRELPAPERVNFFFYLESPETDIQVKEIWLKQKPYAVKEVIVVTPPVVMTNTTIPLNKPDTLVRPTKNKVLQLVIGPEVQRPTISSASEKKITGNEVVVRCIVNGREQYYSVSAIKNLPPVALQ